MDCQKAQTQLLDFLYDELQAGNTARLEEHLRSCEACAEQLNELKTTRGLLGLWQQETVPPDLHRRLVALGGMPCAKTSGWLHEGFRNFLWETLAPAMFGLTAAVLVIGLTVWRSAADDLSTGSLLVCGIVWGEVYNSISQRVLSFLRSQGVQTTAEGAGRAILGGVVAFIVAFILAMVTPNPIPFETREVFLPLAKSIPMWTAYCLPLLWSFAAVLIVGLLFLKGPSAKRREQLAVFGGVYVLLMGLDLVTYAFFDPYATMALLVSWVLTTAVGTLVALLVLGKRMKSE